MKRTDNVITVVGGADTAFVPGMIAGYDDRGVLCPMCGGYTSMQGRHQIRYGATDFYVSLLCRHCERPVYAYIPAPFGVRAASTSEF